MGCIICNIYQETLERYGKKCADAEQEEICNDIAVYHPELVKRINEIRNAIEEE